MSIAAVLRRAQAQIAASDGFRVGCAVRRVYWPRVRGRVAFIEDGWIYWRSEDRHTYASRPAAVERLDVVQDGRSGGR